MSERRVMGVTQDGAPRLAYTYDVAGRVTFYAGRHYHKEMDGENVTVRKFYFAGSTQVAVRVIS